MVVVESAQRRVRVAPAIVPRARELEQVGLRPLDALHLAAAEAGGAEILVTTDDRMIRRSRRDRTAVQIQVLDPISAV